MPIPGYLCGSISIHAPRMGSDPPIRAKMTTSHIFQSTLPHGERHEVPPGAPEGAGISIHAPAWGATRIQRAAFFDIRISIHAPRMGSDRIDIIPMLQIPNFNPRSPHGERLFIRHCFFRSISISIHAPRMGSDIAP